MNKLTIDNGQWAIIYFWILLNYIDNLKMDLDKRQVITKSLLDDLQQASKLIDSVCGRIKQLEGNLDLSRFQMNTARTLSSIHKLEVALLDLEPTLTPDFLKPSLDPIDLYIYLEHYLSAEQSKYQDDAMNKAVKDSVIKEFKSHMTDSIITKFSEAIKSGKGYQFAKRWWSDREKPFIPLLKVYRELKSDRKFLRFQAAKLLEEKFQVQIWDTNNNDVDLISINLIFSKLLEED